MSHPCKYTSNILTSQNPIEKTMSDLTTEQLDILYQHLKLGHTLHILHVAWAPTDAEWTPLNPDGPTRMREMESRIRLCASGQVEIHSSFTEDVERRRMPQNYVALSIRSWKEIQALMSQRPISFDQFRIEKND